jgi:GMP synthase (glutamine-hydrolysing)
MNSTQSNKLNVGILQCGEVLEIFQSQFGDYNSMIEDKLTTADPALRCRSWRVLDGEIPDPDACDAWITTGSRESVNDDNAWTTGFCDFVTRVAQTDIPFIGICYGMQMIARALGGKVALAEKGWGVGVAISKVYRQMSWMREPNESINLLVSHREQVAALPKGAELIAGSDFCPNSIFTVGDHMLGIQGHPEFTTVYSRALMELRRDIIPATRIEQGMDSLSLSVDGARAFDWIVSFIRSGTLASRVA